MYSYILVVDDDIALAYAIQYYLFSKNRKVFIVDNFVAAIKLLNLYKFNLVISDILMQQYSGYDLLSYIRLHQSLSSIPFIFLTAKGMTIDRIKGYNLGCSIYLTKPFHPSELLSIVNNLLCVFIPIRENIIDNIKKTYVTSDFYLTSREDSILSLLVKGHTNKEIASMLNLSLRNVEKYVSRLLSKTKTRNRTELAKLSLLDKSKANDGTRTRE